MLFQRVDFPLQLKKLGIGEFLGLFEVVGDIAKIAPPPSPP